jgi:Ycf4
MKSQNSIVRYEVIGARRLSNYIWSCILSIGGIGFLLTGLSACFRIQFLPFLKISNIQFFPQGLVMCFYGVLGILLGIYILLIILWDLGQGFNEFNLETGQVRIFRWGFPGKNRRIDLQYPIQDIQSIRVEIKEGLNPKRIIYLRLRGNREIPLTRAGQPISIQEIEKQAAELAKLLQVSLEGM